MSIAMGVRRGILPLITLNIVIITACLSSRSELPLLRIRTASLVAEGSIFYFEVENVANSRCAVTVEVPEAFIYDGASHFILSPSEKIFLYLQAPEINASFQEFIFKFYASGDGGEREEVKVAVMVVCSEIIRDFVRLADENANLKQEVQSMEKELIEIRRKLNFYFVLLVITTGICVFLGSAYIIEQIVKCMRFLRRRKHYSHRQN